MVGLTRGCALPTPGMVSSDDKKMKAADESFLSCEHVTMRVLFFHQSVCLSVCLSVTHELKSVETLLCVCGCVCV